MKGWIPKSLENKPEWNKRGLLWQPMLRGVPTLNGQMGYSGNQFQGYRNGALLNFLMSGDALIPTVARSSNTVLTAADVGKLFVCTSIFTQTLTAAATLGNGWFCYLRNDGVNVITVDPNGAETIDGASTLTLSPGASCVLVCDGSNFKTIGLDRGASYTSSDQTITTSGTLALSHGLGVVPGHLEAYLICQTGEGGYSAGDIVPVGFHDYTGSGGIGFSATIDMGWINIQYGNASNVFYICKKSATAGSSFATTNANWKLRIRAWA